MRRREGVAFLLGLVLILCVSVGTVHAMDSSGAIEEDSPTTESLGDGIAELEDVSDLERQMRDRGRGDDSRARDRRDRGRGEDPNCENRRSRGRGEGSIECDNENEDEGAGEESGEETEDGQEDIRSTFPQFFSEVNETALLKMQD